MQLVLSEAVLVIVIEKQLWLTNWVLDPCGIFNSLVAQTLSEGLRVRAGARARRLPVASTPSHNNSWGA
jgi:hypothetical protein